MVFIKTREFFGQIKNKGVDMLQLIVYTVIDAANGLLRRESIKKETKNLFSAWFLDARAEKQKKGGGRRRQYKDAKEKRIRNRNGQGGI